MKNWVLFVFFTLCCSLCKAQSNLKPNLILPIGHTFYVTSAVFSPDGKSIVTASEDYTAKIWDVATGEMLQDLKGHTDEVVLAEFSPDGRSIVTSSKDNTAKIWDVATGKMLQDLTGHTKHVNYALFSPDGRSIVTASDDHTAKIWDVATGKLLQDLTGHSKHVNSALFTPDGRSIVTASKDKTVKIWDVATGKMLQDLTGHTNWVYSAEFSPDGRSIVTASLDGTAKIWDVATGKLLQNSTGHTYEIVSAEFSPDGKSILTASDDKTAKIWDVATGKMLQDLTRHTEGGRSTEFSPDGKSIVTASYDSTAKIWDVATGQLLQDLTLHKGLVWSAEFSPDGESIVTASWDSTAKIWDVATGKMLQDLTGHTSSVYSAQFSPDGKRIVTASFDSTAKIWDVAIGKLLQDLTGHSDWVWSAQFSPDGKSIVTASWDSTAKIWDVATGKLLQDLTGHTSSVYSAQFSPDGKSIVTASEDNTAKIWDVATGKLLQDLTGHTNPVYSAKFSPDGRRIVTASDDNTAKIWEVATGKMFYTFFAVDSTDYLVLDENFRYDGTPAARDYLYFVCGNEIIDLAQMKDALYVPGLVEKIMSGQEINYPKLSDLDICEALPLIEPLPQGKGMYRYRITPRKMGLEQIEVYVNGKKVMGIARESLIQQGTDYYLELSVEELEQHFVPNQENKVNVLGTVRALNGVELKSRGAVRVEDKGEEKEKITPHLYAVMVGVNNYKDPSLKLNYPAKDAVELGRALESSAVKLLGREHVTFYRIHDKGNTDTVFSSPEKEGIRRALEDIGKKARAEDVILIFLAGHGVMQGKDEKLFTFLTAEASELNPVGINTRELQQWLSYEGPHKILANKSILILDACNSGQATKELMALARSDDDTRRIRQVEELKDKSGMFILTASAPNQAAYELPQYEQGLLTYSLLWVLKNNPEVLDDGEFLNIQKWFLESERYLKELAERQGYRQDAQPFGSANIRIGIVDEEVRNSIKLAKEKPVVMCANVLNKNSGIDDLRIKDMINRQLQVFAERGVPGEMSISVNESSNSNKINVMYYLDNDEMYCVVNMLKGDQPIFKKEYHSKKSELESLIELIITDSVRYAK